MNFNKTLKTFVRTSLFYGPTALGNRFTIPLLSTPHCSAVIPPYDRRVLCVCPCTQIRVKTRRSVRFSSRRTIPAREVYMQFSNRIAIRRRRVSTFFSEMKKKKKTPRRFPCAMDRAGSWRIRTQIDIRVPKRKSVFLPAPNKPPIDDHSDISITLRNLHIGFHCERRYNLKTQMFMRYSLSRGGALYIL